VIGDEAANALLTKGYVYLTSQVYQGKDPAQIVTAYVLGSIGGETVSGTVENKPKPDWNHCKWCGANIGWKDHKPVNKTDDSPHLCEKRPKRNG